MRLLKLAWFYTIFSLNVILNSLLLHYVHNIINVVFL
jgi:hypothetical protein